MPIAVKQKQAASIFKLYTRAEYYHELALMISRTKKGGRIFIATMSFKPDELPIRRIMKELQAAAQRGVDVNLLVDAFPFIIGEGVVPGPLWFVRNLPRHLPKIFRRRVEALEKLQTDDGHATIINRPTRRFSNPFAGRSHIKFAVIDDYVFVGGCNLTKVSHLDLMTGWNDVGAADWLCDFARKVVENGSVVKALGGEDRKFVVNEFNSLLMDSGKPGQSLILKQALSLIDAAQEYILITCQYFPNSVTARHLDAAWKRGVIVKIIYNHPSGHTVPLNFLHHSVLAYEKYNRHRELFANQLPKKHGFLHAKLLVTDQGAMIGSHNYVRAGVKFGTAEIALLSSDKHFGKLIGKALEDQLHLKVATY